MNISSVHSVTFSVPKLFIEIITPSHKQCKYLNETRFLFHELSVTSVKCSITNSSCSNIKNETRKVPPSKYTHNYAYVVNYVSLGRYRMTVTAAREEEGDLRLI